MRKSILFRLSTPSWCSALIFLCLTLFFQPDLSAKQPTNKQKGLVVLATGAALGLTLAAISSNFHGTYEKASFKRIMKKIEDAEEEEGLDLEDEAEVEEFVEYIEAQTVDPNLYYKSLATIISIMSGCVIAGSGVYGITKLLSTK